MKKHLILACCAAAVLAACGGGGDGGQAPAPAPTAQVPSSASASVAGLMAYMKALVASTDTDTLEPVDLSVVTAPKDDTIEPETVD